MDTKKYKQINFVVSLRKDAGDIHASLENERIIQPAFESYLS
jgi:hypothetical protein